MVQVENQDMCKIAPLFLQTEDTSVLSCLQGHMGNAWADSIDSPRSAQIITGDFCFFAGDSSIAQARQLVSNIPDGFRSPWIIMIPPNEGWAALIEEAYPGRHRRFERYALKKEKGIFDAEKLRTYADQLPQGYTLAPIEEELYAQSKMLDWFKDCCAQFPSYEEYHQKGLGFAALYQGEPVAAASSYTVYDEGIEIEIDTQKEHRQKGLATACAAKLMLACLERGLYPSWDAANKISLALAEKLGYHFDKAYPAYDIERA